MRAVDIDGLKLSRPKVSQIVEGELRNKLGMENPNKKSIDVDEIVLYHRFGGFGMSDDSFSNDYCGVLIGTDICIGECLLDVGHNSNHKYYCDRCEKIHLSENALLDVMCNQKWLGTCQHMVLCKKQEHNTGSHLFYCPICKNDRPYDGNCVELFRHNGCDFIARCGLDDGHKDKYHEYVCNCGEEIVAVSSIPINDVIATMFFNYYYQYDPLTFTEVANMVDFSKSAIRKMIHNLSEKGVFVIQDSLSNSDFSLDQRKKYVTIDYEGFINLCNTSGVI